jgi:hypothetical protein
MMDLSENLLKLIQIALIVVGVLSIYFNFVDYNITVQAKTNERQAISISNFLLSSSCLTFEDTKSLFDESKLDDQDGTIQCIKESYIEAYVQIKLDGSSESWSFDSGYSNTGDQSSTNVIVMTTSGAQRPAILVVKL